MKMKNFLNKYRFQIKLAGIIIWSILAVIKWIQFSELGQNLFGAVLWTILALYYILGMLRIKRDKQIVEQISLNNNSKSSAE